MFYSAKKAFGYTFPNYDPQKLAKEVCALRKWDLEKIYFYTGIPDEKEDFDRNQFWNAKMAVMGTRQIHCFSRQLRYSNTPITLEDGTTENIRVGREKGIDIRIALDIVRLAREDEFDVALIFSQDQDLTEVVDEIKNIVKAQQRWIRVACAYPFSSTSENGRGINGSEWIKIDKSIYDKCLDPNDYRPKKTPEIQKPQP